MSDNNEAAEHTSLLEQKDREIARLREAKEWLDRVDAAILATNIVPTCTEEKPNGMDRVECIEFMAAEIAAIRARTQPIDCETGTETQSEAGKWDGCTDEEVQYVLDNPSRLKAKVDE